MRYPNLTTRIFLGVLALATCGGCTPWEQYFNNGCKVGPNYRPPSACAGRNWIDAKDAGVRRSEQEVCYWWRVFNDPGLNALICTAYRQNLTLREAGARILQARAQLAIAQGEFFPQTQNMTGSYQRIAQSRKTAQVAAASGSGFSGGPQFFDQWNLGFNLAWEIGRAHV